VKELLDRPGQVALGSADEALLDQALEDAVGDPACALDRPELVVVLDRAQPLDEAPAGNRLDRATAKGLVAGVRNEIGLEADSPREPVRKVGE
jgi:hypothetical protein